jgi:hypothetical protein
MSVKATFEADDAIELVKAVAAFVSEYTDASGVPFSEQIKAKKEAEEKTPIHSIVKLAESVAVAQSEASTAVRDVRALDASLSNRIDNIRDALADVTSKEIQARKRIEVLEEVKGEYFDKAMPAFRDAECADRVLMLERKAASPKPQVSVKVFNSLSAEVAVLSDKINMLDERLVARIEMLEKVVLGPMKLTVDAKGRTVLVLEYEKEDADGE